MIGPDTFCSLISTSARPFNGSTPGCGSSPEPAPATGAIPDDRRKNAVCVAAANSTPLITDSKMICPVWMFTTFRSRMSGSNDLECPPETFGYT